MRFKKTTIGVTLILIIIFLNQYKRQDVFTLIDQGREVPDCVKVLFFQRFHGGQSSVFSFIRKRRQESSA